MNDTKCTSENIKLYNRPEEVWEVDEKGEPSKLLDRNYSTDDSQYFECTGPAHSDIVELSSSEDVKAHIA